MDIDLNSDLGEGCGLDADLMPLITSANISCGYHAGNVDSVVAALRWAYEFQVQVGAHPGYADREHFGRRELDLPEEQVFDLCLEQISAIQMLAKPFRLAPRYLKPHGALYNQACREDRFARPIVAVARQLNLPLLALPNSRLQVLSAGQVEFVAEGFADRRYRPDGTLAPRSQPDALIQDSEEAVEQAIRLVKACGIRSLCLHGDNPHALDFARALRLALLNRGFSLRAFA